ncbi:C-type lectin domain family 14 member A [Epinephelus moara]|uniref:C-type lectin domain family 14 member A n=1 Tax=Epinephelus moara TaxID=300413 RepID=UPI00214F456C|nr:C-type lectin domain family 14 member A [Epinephelus moara]
MEIWFCWIYFLVLFRNISAEPPQYTIRPTNVTFDQALKDCSPGVLTTLATNQEVTDVLRLVSKSASPLQKEFTLWVGLRKVKKQCVVPEMPLRGFKWIEDGSQDSQVNRWIKEPVYSCTSDRCAALKGELDGSTVTKWGLISVTCKDSFQFICKTRIKPASPESAIPEPTPAPPEPTPAPPKPTPAKPQPATPQPTSASPEPTPAPKQPATPESTSATSKPPQPEPKLPSQGPKQETNLTRETGSELQGPGLDPSSEPAQGSDPCKHPSHDDFRSIILDHDNIKRITVQCWPNVLVEVRCWGSPTVWRLLDDNPANFSTICLPCEKGFQKNATGKCLDIDECSRGGGATCRHNCLNTEGSYTCFCSDEDGKQHEEGSPECADTATGGILIPVLIAVAALVVLVVIIAVTVKCCLMRRSKKRAMKKAEKMAMKSKDGKDSYGTANEKVAT